MADSSELAQTQANWHRFKQIQANWHKFELTKLVMIKKKPKKDHDSP